MKKMMFVLLMLFALPAFAQTAVNTDGLTVEQRAAIQATVEQMKREQGMSISANVRQEAEAWGELGTNMGRAIVGAATEVGVAANEFAATPLGKVTVALVVYKFIGQELLGIVVGIGVLVFGYALAIYSFRCLRFARSVQYDYKPFLFGLWNRRVVVSYDESDDWRFGRFIFGAVIIVFASVVGLNCIF